MTNNNNSTTAPLSIYEAVLTIDGERSTMLVGAPHISDWEVQGIGTRVFLRELVRKDTGASRVAIGTRTGTMTLATAKGKGVKVYQTSAKNLAKAIQLRDGRKAKAETYKVQAEAKRLTQSFPVETVKEAEVSETAKIRAWAKANGIAVADRGRIALTTINAYHKAMKKAEKKARKANKATVTETTPVEVEASVNVAALKALPKAERMALLMMLLED